MRIFVGLGAFLAFALIVGLLGGMIWCLWILLYIPAVLGDRALARRKAARRANRLPTH